MVIMLYEMHTAASGHVGWRAHLNAFVATWACAGSIGLGSKFAILDTIAIALDHNVHAHGEFGIDFLVDSHCPEFLWDFMPSFCIAKWLMSVTFLVNLGFGKNKSTSVHKQSSDCV